LETDSTRFFISTDSSKQETGRHGKSEKKDIPIAASLILGISILLIVLFNTRSK
jgi:hypothetical protein